MFHIASDAEIKEGKTTDIYFKRTIDILRKAGLNKRVVAEVRAKTLPSNWKWAILAGIEEVAGLLSGVKVNVKAMREGTVIFGKEPVLVLEGLYTEFGMLETPLLGLICQASGVATMAARCRVAAGEKMVLSFGARRMHPAVSVMIDRSAFIGGCDGVSVIKSAEFLGEEPMGTMPHAFILIVGDLIRACRLFHEIEAREVKRVALIDTFGDEKFEALDVASALGRDLFGVRLDTPGSRRGNFREILEEVRWELDIQGFSHVKLFASGGLDEYSIEELSDLVDAFGVGTSLSNAPVVDFSMDIVEVEGRPIAKRGKLSGRKRVTRCKECHTTKVLPIRQDEGCGCGGKMEDLLIPMIQDGEIVQRLPSPREIRDYVISQIKGMGLSIK